MKIGVKAKPGPRAPLKSFQVLTKKGQPTQVYVLDADGVLWVDQVGYNGKALAVWVKV